MQRRKEKYIKVLNEMLGGSIGNSAGKIGVFGRLGPVPQRGAMTRNASTFSNFA
jgi:hypothetical protein